MWTTLLQSGLWQACGSRQKFHSWSEQLQQPPKAQWILLPWKMNSQPINESDAELFLVSTLILFMFFFSLYTRVKFTVAQKLIHEQTGYWLLEMEEEMGMGIDSPIQCPQMHICLRLIFLQYSWYQLGLPCHLRGNVKHS